MLPFRPCLSTLLVRRRLYLYPGAQYQSPSRPCSSHHGQKKHWKDAADTVVIGGGVMGCSIAYHLAKAGVKDVVLLEKLELTSGSTWHAAGLTTLFNSGVNMKKIHEYSLQLYNQLEEETGQNVGFHKVGSIRLATTPERVDEFRYQMSRHGWHQARQWILTPDEIRQKAPILNMDKILAGLHTPDDGYIDPYSVTQALAIGARNHGADIVMPTKVTATIQRADGQWNVITDKGTIVTKHVINAAGFHAREVAGLAGIDLPVIPIEHQYVVTSSIPELGNMETEIPVIRDLDSSYYARAERQGLLIGPWESGDKLQLCESWARDGVPPDFGKELFQHDIDRIYESLELAMNRMPCLRDASLQTVVNGPLTLTMDGTPTLGPLWDHHNYWVATVTGYGVAQAGGFGKYLADWIVNGEPPFELMESDPARCGQWCGIDFVMEKVRETYDCLLDVVYPKQERWAGRPTARVNGIYQKLKDAGAQFGFCTGWEQPTWFAMSGDETGYKPSFRRTNWFEPVGRECRMVLEKVGIIDLTPSGKIVVKGKDATTFVDKIVANPLPKVSTAAVCYMLTPSGKVISELAVTRFHEDEYFCVTGAASEYHDYRWMQMKAVELGCDVMIERVSDDIACLGIAGPRSRDVLQNLTSESLANNDFAFLQAKKLDLSGVEVTAIRSSSTGELGWELYHAPSETARLYDALMDAGRDVEIGNFGTYAVNSLRLEKGFRVWGREISVDTNPFEAGLEMFTNFEKDTEYVGKSALRKIKENGVKRKLALMTVETIDVDVEGYETIWVGSKVVGHTTSGAFGYQVNKSMCFGFLPVELQTLGTKVEVEILGQQHVATVIEGAPVVSEFQRNGQR